MGVFAIPAALAITGAGAATSAIAASSQNRAIERSMSSQWQAAAAQQQQIVNQGAVENLKSRFLAEQIEGKVRVAAGESGVGFGGSYAALARQADTAAEYNQAITDRNVMTGIANVRSGYQASTAQLSAGYQSPLLSAFLGGLSGLGTGLQIPGATEGISNLFQAPTTLEGMGESALAEDPYGTIGTPPPWRPL